MQILHNFFPQRCVNHLVWRDNVLVCRKCGRIAAVRYKFDGRIRVYTMESFRPFENKIREMPTTMCYVVHDNAIEEVTFSDFDDLIKDLRKELPIIEQRDFYEGTELDQERFDTECSAIYS